jgi:hypothetical protein
VAFEQCGEDARRIDASNLADFERRDRLLVGNDRQRFQRLHGQLLRRPFVKQAPHPFVQLGAGHDLVTARYLDELQARTPVVVVLQCLNRRGDVFLRFVGEQLEQHSGSEWLGRREDQRFDDGL